MTLSERFLAISGGVCGRDHRRAERDGQDGHALVANDHVVAAIVTDGCSSGSASELGARLGAAWLAALVAQRFTAEVSAVDAADAVTRELVVRLSVLARSLDPDGELSPSRIDDALLFTFLVAAVTPVTTIVFGIGDGLVLTDDGVTRIDPGPRNAPPYVAYELLRPEGKLATPRVHHLAPTDAVNVVAVATDGLDGLAASLRELADHPRDAINPSLLRKRLVVLSDQGAFSDDATLAVIRRRAS